MNSHSPQTRDEKQFLRTSSALRPGIWHWKWMLVFLLAFALLAGACASTTSPVKSFTKGDEIAYYDFSQPGTFEEGAYDSGKARLEIREGAYHMDLTVGDSVLWYGQWGDTLRDVVVDVETHQTTESQNTTYGVMCRARGTVGQAPSKPDADLSALAGESTGELVAGAVQILQGTPANAEATAEATQDATTESATEATSEATFEVTSGATQEATTEAISEATPEATPAEGATALDANNANNGDGYLFLIEGTGRFAIMRSRGRNVTPLVDWTASPAIKAGPANNRIRAVCMGDYLAMYINGEFMGEATDDTYTRGQIGLLSAAANRLGNQVAFDNLSVSEATPGS